jgi:hypothetical protein
VIVNDQPELIATGFDRDYDNIREVTKLMKELSQPK